MGGPVTATIDGLDASLAAAAAAWLAEDPDPVTAAELRGLLAAATATGSAAAPADPSDRAGELAGEEPREESTDAARDAALAELADAFTGPLEFGTAGLRGRLGPGPNRMNRVVVARAAAGLAAHLHATGGHTVVIGHDARHNSAVFARDTADIAAGAGLRAVLLPRALPTPLLAASVLALGASAGVMVTASHNPAPDNGYKVYLGDGRQIVAPADAAIAARIAAVGALRDLPRAPDDVEVPDVDGPDGLLTRYLARLQVLVGGDSDRGGGNGDGSAGDGVDGSLDGAAGPARPGVALVTTALHGVGGPVLAAALAAAGFTQASPVAAQEAPDPAFGGMPFPNPEEPGVLDQAIAQAAATGADLVLACDPDADRCAVAVPDPRLGWRRLSGDELGSLLAWRVLTTELAPLAADDHARGAAPERGQDTRHGVAQGADHPGPARTVLATTIVSSTQIDALAARAGAPVAHTLTGFKWLTRVPGLRFAYEEALGYCVDPATVADKDGISACLVVADLAARLKAGQLPRLGASLTDVLDRIDADCGVVATGQLSIRVTRLARRDELLAALAADPPQRLGPFAVTRVDDLGAGVDGLPPTPGLRLTLRSADPDRTVGGRDEAAGRGGDGSRWDADDGRDGRLTGRVVVRPSGTEAKLKCYLQVAPAPTEDVEAARGTAAAALAAVRHDLAARLA